MPVPYIVMTVKLAEVEAPEMLEVGDVKVTTEVVECMHDALQHKAFYDSTGEYMSVSITPVC